MYLTAQRILRIKDKKGGINVFLYQHGKHDLPPNAQFSNVDWITNQYPGKLIAESVDLVPGGNAVLSFIDIVGREGLDKECIQYFLDQMKCSIKDIHTPITKSASDLAVKFGITLGLKGQEIREYKALTERAMRLFESREPPRWRSEDPWIVIHCSISDNQEIFSLSPDTAEKLKQIYDESWIPERISLDLHYGTKRAFQSIHGDLIQYIAPVLTDLTLEQIAAQGGLILYNPATQKKIKWPELREI